MAETLGSLVDKLSIKVIRGYFMTEMLQQKETKFPKSEIEEKLKRLQEQKDTLQEEIEDFVCAAAEGRVTLRDEKLKLYNKPEVMGKTAGLKTVAQAIEALTAKNLELWRLEDEARREDVPLSFIGEVKRKIDVTNQQRNDYIDRIDELLAQEIAHRQHGTKK